MSKYDEKYYHDKGEQDRSEYEKDHDSWHYQRPNGIIEELTTWDKGNIERQARENEAYDKGWNNTDDQIKGKK